MSLALHHRSCSIFVVVVLFCSLLKKGSFKVQYLLIVLKVAIVRTMVQMTSTDRQADHNLSKLKTIQQFIFLVLESFKTLSPELAFSWLESKNTNLSSGQTDSHYYHRLDQCISENLLFPYHEIELPCLEVISEYKVSIHFSPPEIPHQRDG